MALEGLVLAHNHLSDQPLMPCSMPTLGVDDAVIYLLSKAYYSQFDMQGSTDVLEAERHFKKILEEFRDEDCSNFSCLSYYGLSRVHLRWNRYKEARSFIEKSLKLVESNLVPGLQTWPGTDTAIEETRDGVLKDLLNALLKECLCPPKPDAVCHYRFCSTHNSKQDIYRSDPDFKGFVRVHCSYDCRIEYHLYCWKRCKIKEFQDKIEKDILGLDCLTPDCMGCIWKVDIFQDSRQKTAQSTELHQNIKEVFKVLQDSLAVLDHEVKQQQSKITKLQDSAQKKDLCSFGTNSVFDS
ncbi:E3 ubiquitin-protein ligase TTC3-like [Hypanus sabinus]|uniref:E3 ubiquitin-protein ligase TTC3-like n=1 Tax=Hypanus sabinus TaxID=79690 RepID=UPI0028C47112|nr:E3 ubiquitin-protein ligase TTC3-like [Hypanus sabinus]